MKQLFHIDSPDEYVRQRGRALILVYAILIGVCVIYIPYILFVADNLSEPGMSVGLAAGSALFFALATRLAKSARIDASMFLSSISTIGVILLVHAVERTMLPSVWLVIPAVMLTSFARRPRHVGLLAIPLIAMFALLIWLLGDHVPNVKLYDEYARLGAISITALAMSYMTVSVHQRIMPELGRIRVQEQDATEAAHALRELAQEERVHLERAHAEKDAFLASMSHELRTPLTAIMGLAEVIEEELEFDEAPIPDDVIQASAGIQREANAFLEMCQRALEIAQQDTNSVELHPWTLDLGRFVEDVYTSVGVTMRSRGVHVQFEHALTNPSVTHDSLWMRRMLLSVFLFLGHRNSEGDVTIRLQDTEDDITLSSVDHGQALDMKSWAALEEDSAETSIEALPYAYRELLLARRLARAMGGSIHVSTTPEDKTTHLELSFPRHLSVDGDESAEFDGTEEQRRLDELLDSSKETSNGHSKSLRERISAYYNPAHLPLEDRIPAGALMRLLSFGTFLLIGTLSWRLAALSNEPGHLPVVIVRVVLICWTIASVELCRRGRAKLAISGTSVFLMLLTVSTAMRTMGVSASSNLYVAVLVQLMIVRATKEIVALSSIVAAIALGIHIWFGFNPVEDPLFPYYSYLSGGITYAIVIVCVTILGVMCAQLNTSELELAKSHIRKLMRARHQEQRGRQQAELARANTNLADQVRARFLTSLSEDVNEPLGSLQEHIEVLDRALSSREDGIFDADLANLKDAMARLRWLVDDVLMFAMIRAERVSPRAQEVTLQQVWARAQELITERLGHTIPLHGLEEDASIHGITDLDHASQLLAQFVLIDTELGDPELHIEDVGPHGVTFSMTLTPFATDDPRLQIANSMVDFRSSFFQALQGFLDDENHEQPLSTNRRCFVRFRAL